MDHLPHPHSSATHGLVLCVRGYGLNRSGVWWAMSPGYLELTMSVSIERLLVVAHGGDCTVEERLAFETWMVEVDSDAGTCVMVDAPF